MKFFERYVKTQVTIAVAESLTFGVGHEYRGTPRDAIDAAPQLTAIVRELNVISDPDVKLD